METLLASIDQLSQLPLKDRVKAYNKITQAAHNMLGFAQKHPCLAPQLIERNNIVENHYNPNRVAPQEMNLLRLSIRKEGLTMPIVVNFVGGTAVIVDGFHRTQICRRDDLISNSLENFIPCSLLSKSGDDRMAATVRHNMARGTHQTVLSAELITLLKKHNWTDEKIGKEIGMDPDEILRLKQITGIAETFSDVEYSNSWKID